MLICLEWDTWKRGDECIAYFKNVEVKDGAILKHAYGVGSTIKEAKRDYLKKIEGKLLVKDAMLPTRQEFTFRKNYTGSFCMRFALKTFEGFLLYDPDIERVAKSPDKEGLGRPKVIWHVTTKKKLQRYRTSGKILKPVRGFDTLLGAMAWALKTGRNIILKLDLEILKDYEAKVHKLPDHHNKWGNAWWIDEDVPLEAVAEKISPGTI